MERQPTNQYLQIFHIILDISCLGKNGKFSQHKGFLFKLQAKNVITKFFLKFSKWVQFSITHRLT